MRHADGLSEENDLKLEGVFPEKYNEKLVRSGSRARVAFSLAVLELEAVGNLNEMERKSPKSWLVYCLCGRDLCLLGAV